jgi:hypothetical protein
MIEENHVEHDDGATRDVSVGMKHRMRHSTYRPAPASPEIAIRNFQLTARGLFWYASRCAPVIASERPPRRS